jgi:hypothetical protein
MLPDSMWIGLGHTVVADRKQNPLISSDIASITVSEKCSTFLRIKPTLSSRLIKLEN